MKLRNLFLFSAVICLCSTTLFAVLYYPCVRAHEHNPSLGETCHEFGYPTCDGDTWSDAMPGKCEGCDPNNAGCQEDASTNITIDEWYCNNCEFFVCCEQHKTGETSSNTVSQCY